MIEIGLVETGAAPRPQRGGGTAGLGRGPVGAVSVTSKPPSHLPHRERRLSGAAGAPALAVVFILPPGDWSPRETVQAGSFVFCDEC